MSIDVTRLERLLATLGEYGQGITIRYVYAGGRNGGFESEDVYDQDGWEIGCMDANGGEELSLDIDINAALDKAAFVIQSEWEA